LFDFTHAPQLRFHVHVLGAEQFQFTLTENHAIFDGWSLHSTLADIFGRYFAYLRGENPEPNPPIALTFRDFVAAEKRALESPEARAFWRERLAGAARLELASGPERRVRGARIGRLNGRVAPDVSTEVRRFARATAVPLKSVLLGAQLRVMGLYSGQNDIMIGLGYHGRPEVAEGDQVRGLFLNTLPLRVQLLDESFRDLTER